MPPSSKAAAAAAHGFGADFARPSADIFDDIFGDGRRPARRRAAAASAARTCATTWRSRSRRPSPARPREIAHPDLGHLRGLLRHRRQARHQARRPARPAAATARCARTQGFFTIERTCPTCQGRGQVIDNPCPTCARRRAASRASARSSVNIPAGVEDGTRIRLAGEGEAGLRGGPPGDLYIFLSLTPHEFFQRDGADLLLPRADLDGDGGARRRVRGADHRRRQDAR